MVQHSLFTQNAHGHVKIQAHAPWKITMRYPPDHQISTPNQPLEVSRINMMHKISSPFYNQVSLRKEAPIHH